MPSARPRPGDLDTGALRRHWPEIIDAVRALSRRTAGALESIQVIDYDGRRLLVGMPDERWIRHFMGTSNEEALRQGVLDALALDVRIEATVAGPDGPSEASHSRPGDQPPTAQGPTGGGASAQQPSGPGSTQGPSVSAQPVQEQRPPEQEAPDDYPSEPPAQDYYPAEPPAPGQDAPAPSAQDSGAPGQLGPGAQAQQPQSPPPVPDVPQRGRIRTRGGQGASTPQTGGGAAQVRVRGRSGPSTEGGPDARASGSSTSESSTAEPSMAEQLGAGGGRSSAPAGPDWSQTARSTSAPAWATDGGASADRQIDPDLAGGTPAEGGPGPDEREAVRAEASPAPASLNTPHDAWADAPSEDDEDLSTSGAVGQPVIENVLGGTVIAINDEPVG